MFCRNVDSFPFRQISGALSACSHALLGKVLPNFSGDDHYCICVVLIILLSVPTGDHGPRDAERNHLG